jgi:hypothetical protein
LRPRYDPKWIPSWKQPNAKNDLPYWCEDGTGMLVNTIPCLYP